MFYTYKEMTLYCCEDFKDMLDSGLIEEDKGKARSRGWYKREQYIIKCFSEVDCNAHVYMKYCLRCGAMLSEVWQEDY